LKTNKKEKSQNNGRVIAWNNISRKKRKKSKFEWCYQWWNKGGLLIPLIATPFSEKHF
jgi:hypothetical protein